MEIIPQSSVIGAEIRGLDLSASLDDDSFAQLNQAFQISLRGAKGVTRLIRTQETESSTSSAGAGGESRSDSAQVVRRIRRMGTLDFRKLRERWTFGHR